MSSAEQPQPHLTHLDEAGAARMVDVSAKHVSARTARATGRVRVSPEVVALLRGEGVPKGDALATARIAGIAGAKRTPELIPLCHPLALSGVAVELAVADDAVELTATVRTTDRTGVEMEALTAVSVAALTVVDMVKAVDKSAVITDVRVEEKTGGKSGDWTREGGAGRADAADGVDTGAGAGSAGPGAAEAEAAGRPSPAEQVVAAAHGTGHGDAHGTGHGAPAPAGSGPAHGRRPYRALAVTASNRAAAGVYADRGGPLLVEGLAAMGFAADGPRVVPDGEPVAEALREAVAAGYDVVLTTGGTGISPTDRTPEMTRGVLDHEIPGITEAIRTAGRAKVPTAALSRGVAGVAGRTLIVNLPGSSGGVRDGLAVLDELLVHAVDQVRGGDHPRGDDPH
ncbi:bifunctional molybdenum cofactor biosynthesis protein MoaC/MoaB [Streptomyces sp. JJ36]|uniref:bifunctional molybdenum cofactor biosynthesis protein MoaC/MoaB n=1 Tax=Streptomyces sp. JJ36 TaxID=2736645 RepID=UPI001F001198|nr:bifunctional molybdenum cofactor biosynthesis protein MoaC/MoaB [Streptomyces sp. JJ36]MCF6522304.1 bifunctional molybdenum cofactor biosynthesis protein MoaC/MoaB [Streptomyces sp. JJ36]